MCPHYPSLNREEIVSFVAVVSSVDSNNGMKGEDIVKSNKKECRLLQSKERPAGLS